MNTTGKTLRPSFVAAHPLSSALAGGLLALALVLAGIGLLRSPERVASAPESKARALPAPVYDATGAMQAAIVPSSSESWAARPVPVYDASGAMLTALRPAAPVAGDRPAPVYDATGAMLEATGPTAPETGRAAWAPVYDASAAMWAALPFIRP